MRSRIIILCLLMLSYRLLQAQSKSIDELMRLKPVGIGAQIVDTFRAVYLPMPFAEAHFITAHQLSKIPDASYIYSINLVYTRYREVDSFNQPKLNYYRFKELEKIYPTAFKQADIEWNVIEQRSARTKEKAIQCFHGFVIYLKNTVPPEVVEKEIKTITSVIDSYSDTMVWIPESIVWKVKRRKTETGFYYPNNEQKRKDGVLYNRKSIWFRKPEYKVTYDSSIRHKTGGYYRKVARFDTSTYSQTSEFNFLTNRKWSDKMAVVTDVTGSMSPYSTQVMLWLKHRPEILQHGRFTFFNDGDAMPDMFKKIGQTGGIYFAPYRSFDSVYSVMKYTMHKGLGGDLPENNLEAVLKTLERWPDTDTVLLIADINAAVKDIKLLDKVKKPVHVMVCGTAPTVHADYIQIVKATGGKLFILDTEISSLKGLYTGQRIPIGGKIWEWRNNTFNRID